MITIPERFIAKRVITDAGCWEWAGSRRNGYGRASWNGRIESVHRVVASIAHGLDLNERWQFACHSCDNPPCFNPDHLFIGTAADNNRDCKAKDRQPGAYTYKQAATLYPRSRPCAYCGREYEPSGHRSRSGVCSDACLRALRAENGRGRSHKLTEEDIREIRKALDARVPPKLIAEQFGISRPTVSNIKLGKTWGHAK